MNVNITSFAMAANDPANFADAIGMEQLPQPGIGNAQEQVLTAKLDTLAL